MSTGSLVFTGISKYSSDLQTILQRAVSIAQLPIKKLQNTQADNLSKKQALIALNPAVANLGAAVSSLGTLAAKKAVSATSSDVTKVTVANTGATGVGIYTVSNILTLAAAASEKGLSGYADPAVTPVSTVGQNEVDLVVGGTTYQLDLTGNNNLNGLRDAINNSGAAANASIVTIDGNSYLTLTANNTGATTLSLTDVAADPLNSVSLITQTNQGTDADFFLNGIHTTKSTNTINDMIPGLSFTLRGTTVGSVTLSLQTDSSQLSLALQTFVNNYNALFDQASAQTGTSAGPLGGDWLIRNITDDLRQLASYWNPSESVSIHSLSDLGITFTDTAGHMSFDSTFFNQLSTNQITDAFKFLGSSQAGFAKLAANFTQLSDPVTGMIRLQEDGYDTENTQLSDRISSLNDRVSLMQSSMSAKLQMADALLAQLEARQTTITASLQSLAFVAYGKQTNNGL
jgi:flagellar hook-associated protein 2